jgi:hypothetical protein
MDDTMDVVSAYKEAGLRKMIRKGREIFQIPENINHYSPENYKVAEKIFIKRCILEGRCDIPATAGRL